MRNTLCTLMTITALWTGAALSPAQAAIALDRTRVIFDGDQKSVTLGISNQNKQLPYLAQGWIEDAAGNKIQGPLTVLPPVQRVEPDKSSQVKIQALPAVAQLPQDRESLFYFNLREIPPRSNTPNTLQIALQSRIKLFFRPHTLVTDAKTNAVWQEKLTLTRQGNKFRINNPTPYYVTIIDAAPSKQAVGLRDFAPLMIAPKGNGMMNVAAAALGNAPVLTYINDYGGRPKLTFTCGGDECHVVPGKSQR